MTANSALKSASVAPSLGPLDEDSFVARVVEAVGAEDYIARAVEADRTTTLARENLRVLQELDVAGMVVDPAFGDGAGASLGLISRVIEAVAYRDASTAVALNMHWLGARALNKMPSFPRGDEALAAIAAHEALMCGAFSVPSGAADARKAKLSCRIDGEDLVLNGRAGFGSMSDAATYVMLGGELENSDADEPMVVATLGRFGEPGLINHKNWSAMGMRATGSNDIECVDFRVPKSDCALIPLSAMLDNSDVMEMAAAAFGVTSIWLGLSRAALDFTVEHTKERYGYMAEGPFNPVSASYRSDEPWAQIAIGNMDHWVGTGRVLLRDMIARIGDYSDGDLLVRDLQRTLFHLRRMAEEVAMGSMRVCGAHGYVTSRPLERYFRDLIGGVVMAWKTDQVQQSLGLGALGRPVKFTGPAGS